MASSDSKQNEMSYDEMQAALASFPISIDHSRSLHTQTPWHDERLRQQVLQVEALTGSWVLMVWLQRAIGLRAADFGGYSDPYIQFSLRPSIPHFRHQLQRSTKVMRNLNPEWVPPQLFRFIILNPQEAKLTISVLDWDRLSSDDPLGDACLSIESLIGRPEQILQLNLFDTKTGEDTGSVVEVKVQLVPRNQGFGYQEFFVYEYQRWRADNWGHTSDFLLETDPKHWGPVNCYSNPKEGSSMIFDEVARPVPQGWEVLLPWSVFSTQDDKEGWQYSTDFGSSTWSNSSLIGFVRRRVWRQIVRDPSVWSG